MKKNYHRNDAAATGLAVPESVTVGVADELFSQTEILGRTAMQKMLAGLSTRRCTSWIWSR